MKQVFRYGVIFMELGEICGKIPITWFKKGLDALLFYKQNVSFFVGFQL